MKGRLKTILVIAVLSCITALLVWVFMRGRKESAMEQEREPPVKEASRVSAPQEEGIVTLGVDAQKRGDIVAVPVKAMTHAEKIRAYGTVLQLQNLTELRSNYVQAKAQFEKALANLDLSKREYERLRPLNEDNKNVSDKALQAAEATRLNDEANVHASQEAVNILEETAHQQWGSVLAGWMLSGSPSFHRLIQQKDVLIQFTLPADSHISRMPQSISIMLGDGSVVSAGFVSPSTRTDPRIQGTSLFYAAPSERGKILTGMNVTADLPSGPPANGVFIPASSVVWRQGKSWIYVQKGSDQFIRREISTETPVKDGWFVLKGVAAGDRIVVKGPQLLMSEESRSRIQVGD
jgi:hypothetical protein